MSYDLIFLLKEPSLHNILEQVLPKLIPMSLSYKCIPHQGKQDLAKSIYLSLTENKSPSFQVFCAGIEKIVESILKQDADSDVEKILP